MQRGRTGGWWSQKPQIKLNEICVPQWPYLEEDPCAEAKRLDILWSLSFCSAVLCDDHHSAWVPLLCSDFNSHSWEHIIFHPELWLGVKAAELVLDVKRIMELTKYGFPHEPPRDQAFRTLLLCISILVFALLDILMVSCKEALRACCRCWH